MFWNIAIAVILAAIAAIVSGLAGHLAATKPWHKWLFWGSGVVMVSLIGIQTYRNEKAQDRLQTQLDKIQKQTEQPPSVTVNIPPSKQRAIMALSKEHRIGLQLFIDPENSWSVNTFCENIGSITARQVKCGQLVKIIAAKNGVPSNEILENLWQDASKSLKTQFPTFKAVDLEPWSFTWGSQSLHMQDVDPELNSGSKVIAVAGQMLFSDDVGSHKKEFCLWAQAPFNPDSPVWQLCATGHNTNVY